MKIIDEDCLEQFRTLPACEWCGALRRPDERLQPHHIFSRGAGRLDIKINLVGLCWVCHRAAHDCAIRRSMLLLLVARREAATPKAIGDEVLRLRALDKHARVSDA